MSVLQGPGFYISKRVGRAIMDYQMLSDGDKIAVVVSGGKDSLTLRRDISCFWCSWNRRKALRTKITNIIKDLKKVCPEVKTNIFRSIKRIKKDYLL